MTKKLRTCGRYRNNPDEIFAWKDEVRPPPQPAAASPGALPQKVEEENKIGTGTINTHDIFNDIPTTSKHHNFDRQRTVVRMHMPFAHDLASFISMVDGKI